MFRLRLSHFLVVSLALHAAILHEVHHDRPPLNWSAGPVIVRLMPAPESSRESRPTSGEKAATAVGRKQAAVRQAASAAENALPQHRPARVPAAQSAAVEERPGTGNLPGSAQREVAENAARSTTLEQQLLDSLHAALIPHFSYPLLARRRGWEGIVRVGMRIEANGTLTRLHVVEPSPYSVLDTAAINSLSRLARLPDAGTWLQGSHVDLVLPVEYRLVEG